MIEIMCSWLEGLCICLNYSGCCEETEEERKEGEEREGQEGEENRPKEAS